MSYRDQFPGFQLDVEIPEGFKDTSWRNDACPSWANNDGVVLWVADRDPELREFPEAGRFTVQWPTDTEMREQNSDDWQIILAIIKALA